MTGTVTKKQLSELSSPTPRVKYRRAKILLTIAKKNPRLLYTHFPFFAGLLEHENNILKWTGIDVIGGLAGVDRKNRVEELIEKLEGFLQGGKLITANHAIAALGQIALSKPTCRDRVVQDLLNVERVVYETDECHNIALGKVVDAFESLSIAMAPGDAVLAFVERQTSNSRPATRKKAERYLKKHRIPSQEG